MNYSCGRCQDRAVVGGFLPMPCPECRAAPGACEYCGAMDNHRERLELDTKLQILRAEFIAMAAAYDRAVKEKHTAEQERDEYKQHVREAHAERDAAIRERDEIIAAIGVGLLDAERRAADPAADLARVRKLEALGQAAREWRSARGPKQSGSLSERLEDAIDALTPKGGGDE